MSSAASVAEPPTERLTRRTMLKSSALAGAGLLLAGCSSAVKRSSAGGSSSAQTLTLGTSMDLNPPDFLGAGSNTPVSSLVFDTLAVLDGKLEAQPSVATSWHWNGDRTELTVNLRDDVRYHSGRLLAPKDVIFTVSEIRKPDSNAQIGGMAAHIRSMAQTGQHQLKFVLDQPISSFTDLLVMAPLVDSETFSGLENAKRVIGTGPFVFGQWTPGTSVTLSRNARYWQTGRRPYLDSVKVRIFGSEQALVAAMSADELDLAWDLVPSDATRLAQGGSYPSVSTTPFFAEWYVGANVKVAPLDDVRTRQAIAYALDRARIVKQAFSDFGTATSLPWRPNAPGLTGADNTYYGYDPQKAKALFKAAGSPSTTIPIVTGAGNTITEAITNIVQFNLTGAGFKVKVKEVQETQFNSLLGDAKIPGLWINSVGQCDLSIATVLLGNAPFKVAGNTSNVTAQEYVSLADKVIRASTDAEIAATQQALTRYILQQAWHMTIGHVPYVSARTPKLSGVSATAGLAVDLTDAKL